MKSIIYGIFTVLFMAIPASAASVCSHVDLAWISEQVPLSPGTKIVLKQEQGDVCEVVMAIDGTLAPVYAGKDFIVVGRMFKLKKSITRDTMAGLSDVAERERADAKEKQALALEKRKVFFKANSGSLDPLVSMTFGPGHPKGSVYVITDPNCSHCKKLLPLMEEVAFEAKLTLKIIIYPVLGKKSRDMASHALCNNYSYEQYKEMTGSESLAVCDRSSHFLEKTTALFSSADVSFVPLVVAENGSWVVEGSDIAEVREHLGLDCPEGTDGKGQGCGPGQKE